MWNLAIRHLMAKKVQTLLILVGVLFGAVAYIAVSGFFVGFQDFMVASLINNDGHVKINTREEIVDGNSLKKHLFGKGWEEVVWSSEPTSRSSSSHILNPNGWYTILKSEPEVVAFTPLLSVQVTYTLANTSASGTLIGNDPNKHVQVTTIGEYMEKGNFLDLAMGGNRIILGDGLAKKIGASLSQTIFVSFGAEKSVPFKVVGLFHTGNFTFDDVRAYASLKDVQRVAGMSNQINEISIKLRDYNNATAMALQWSLLGSDKIQSWDQLSASFLSMFVIQNIMRFFVVTVVMIVAAFGIYNVLNMAVNHKKKEIAILRSMGFESKDIMQLFFTQGLIVGLCGGVIGLVLGYLICLGIQMIPISGEGPFGDGLKISFSLAIYLTAFGISVFTAIIASILPARAASKLSPIKIIREGAE